ncbi:hypothetical protein HDU76_007530, partial [Blyttiomyces sp. JEL0837]
MKSTLTGLITLIASFASLALAAPLVGIERRSDSTNQYPYGSSSVSIINTYHTETYLDGEDGIYKYGFTFQVDFAVKNNAFVKEVGVRFTNNSWTNRYEAQAHYNTTLDNGYELWTWSVDRGAFWSYQPGAQAEYELAAYVSYNNGPREWDPRNNYYI